MSKLNNAEYKKGLIKTILTSLILLCVYLFIEARYEFVFDGQEDGRSTIYSMFVIDKWNKEVTKNDHVAFNTPKMKPYFPEKTLIVKQIKGTSGDKIEITDVLKINGELMGELNLLERLNKTAFDYMRTEILKKNEMFVLGIDPRSYDSRYWGNITTDNIVGKAYGIF